MPAPESSRATSRPVALKRFLRYYYLSTMLYDFIFAYAIYTVFLRLRGVSILQISLLLSWWTLTSLALEIPTGALADIWSRRKLLALAPLVKSLCFVTWFLARDFYLFALGFLLWSTASALCSGTSEAILYDTLARHGEREGYEAALGRRQVYFHVGLALALLSGGFIASYSMELTMLISVVPLLLSSVFAMLMEETPKAERAAEVRYLQHIGLALREIGRNKAFRYLLVYLLGISILWDLEEFDQLYYRLAGLPIWAFGVALFIESSLCALASGLACRLKHHVSVMYALPFASAVMLVFVWRFPSLPAIGLLLLAYVAAIPVEVLVESRIQHTIAGVSRATVTSALSLLIGVFGVGVPIVFGLISRAWHLPAIYLAAALPLFVLSLWAFCSRKRMEVPVEVFPPTVDRSPQDPHSTRT